MPSGRNAVCEASVTEPKLSQAEINIVLEVLALAAGRYERLFALDIASHALRACRSDISPREAIASVEKMVCLTACEGGQGTGHHALSPGEASEKRGRAEGMSAIPASCTT